MAFRRALIIALFLSVWPGVCFAASLDEARSLVDSREYQKAEEMLSGLISSDEDNAALRQLLGDVYRNTGRLIEAIAEYRAAEELGPATAELYKKAGTAYKWKRDYPAAAAYYRKALELDPGDREAAEDLDGLKRLRGLSLRVSTGGWEPDYTTDSYEASIGYGGFGKLELNAGYGSSDQIFYERTKLFASAYYFYSGHSYVKLYAARKNYDYPSGGNQLQPDSSAYDIVPSVEVEVSHWVNRSLRTTLAYEFFRPSFFHDPDSSASNHKVSGELYYLTPLDGLRLKAIAAVLRDPDPDKTLVKRADDLTTPLVDETVAATSVVYQTQALVGGAVEYASGGWNAEVKYLPNRDLDRSYAWSVLAGLGYDITEGLTGRLDYVHDKYSDESRLKGQTADVYMVSAYWGVSPNVDLGAGYKRIKLPETDKDAFFLTLTYRTGLVF